jgi:hypothetical protein
MVASVVTRVLQRNVLKVVETAHHVAISEHAVFRIFERGGSNDKLTIPLLERATLWTPVLLFALFGLNAKRSVDDGTEIAIPFAGGLLLGTIETNRLDGPEQGPTITAFKRGGHKLRRIKAPFQFSDDRIPTIGINTYVSRYELFENQQTIFDGLEKFEELYRTSMINMRRLCALGYPDAEVTKVLGPIQFSEIDSNALIELGAQIRAFFDTPEWKTHSGSHRPRARLLQ